MLRTLISVVLTIGCAATFASATGYWAANPDSHSPSPAENDWYATTETAPDGNQAQVGDITSVHSSTFAKGQTRLWSHSGYWYVSEEPGNPSYQFINSEDSEGASGSGSWAKSYGWHAGPCDGGPTDPAMASDGSVVVAWWLDGDCNNGDITAAWARTESESEADVSTNGSTGTLYFNLHQRHEIDRREGGTTGVAGGVGGTGIPYVGFTYTGSDDTWSIAMQDSSRSFYLNFYVPASQYNLTTAYAGIHLDACAEDAYDTAAFHAYSCAEAETTYFSLTKTN